MLQQLSERAGLSDLWSMEVHIFHIRIWTEHTVTPAQKNPELTLTTAERTFKASRYFLWLSNASRPVCVCFQGRMFIPVRWKERSVWASVLYRTSCSCFSPGFWAFTRTWSKFNTSFYATASETLHQCRYTYLQDGDLLLLQLPCFVLHLRLLGVNPHHPLLHLWPGHEHKVIKYKLTSTASVKIPHSERTHSWMPRSARVVSRKGKGWCAGSGCTWRGSVTDIGMSRSSSTRTNIPRDPGTSCAPSACSTPASPSSNKLFVSSAASLT